jgi:hypothetical protein
MDEALEALQYLFGFWRFSFSKQFRAECIAKFKRMSLPRKLIEVIGGLISTAVGLGLPVLIVYWVFFTDSVAKNVDACLDSGGSFNYQSCECDYELSHLYIEKHQCK